jgi:signal transduction histidine kinase
MLAPEPVAHEPSVRLLEARASAERLLRSVALAPILGMGVATLVGAAGIYGLRGAGIDVAPASVGWILGVTGLTMLVCARWALRAPRAAAQVATASMLVSTLLAMWLSPEIGVPVGSLAAGACAVGGTLSARPGAWRWGPITAVAWGGAVLSVPLPVQERAGMLFFPPLLFLSLTALVAKVTQSLAENQAAALESLEALQAANEHLVRGRRAADAANQAKSSFLASMSHELRTPLNAIIGYSELILDAPKELDLGDVERIGHAGRHLLSLVNDVLDMSRIESGALEIHDEVVHVRALFDELRAVADGLAQDGDNRLAWEVAADVPERLRGDRLRVRQVLLNLVGNALKFTRQGSVRVAVQIDGGMLAVAVEDTGPGIDPELLQRLFVPFSQGRSRGLKHGGTGLGLAISQSLAHAMGGSIRVQTELGAGSVFLLELPLRTDGAVEVAGVGRSPVVAEAR